MRGFWIPAFAGMTVIELNMVNLGNCKQVLFPQESREFAGMRWLKIFFRTLHLIGLAGIGGGFLYASDFTLWSGYYAIAIGSGIALVAIEIWSNCIFLIQLRGLSIFLKLWLLYVLHTAQSDTTQIFIAIIILSSVISHAPGKVRYFSVFHGRKITTL